MVAQQVVPCLNPSHCGVRTHLVGSEAHKNCISKVARGVMPHNPASSPPPLRVPDKGLTPDAIGRINDFEGTKEDIDNLKKAFFDSLDTKSFNLYYTDQDEALWGSDLELYLSGRGEDLNDSILVDAGRTFVIADQSFQEVREILYDEFEVEMDAIPEETQEEMAMTIRERDDSDVLSDMVKNTPAQLMRYQVSPIKGRVDGDAGRSIYVRNPDVSVGDIIEARVDLLEKGMLDSQFIDSPLTQKEKDRLREAIANGPEYFHEGVSLDAIWTGPISGVNLPAEWQRPQGKTKEDTLRTVGTDNGIYMVLIDTWNGNGFDFYLDRPVTMKLSQSNHARTDDQAPGHGWDAIAGVYKDGFYTSLEDK